MKKIVFLGNFVGESQKTKKPFYRYSFAVFMKKGDGTIIAGEDSQFADSELPLGDIKPGDEVTLDLEEGLRINSQPRLVGIRKVGSCVVLN